jgi:hypothetical protein
MVDRQPSGASRRTRSRGDSIAPWQNPPVLQQLRDMPRGVLVFLVYAFLLLALVGLTTPLIINQAVESPISPIGVVWMLLLAYLIFTITLTLQRKQAGYPLAIGLSTLTLPFVLFMYFSPAQLLGAAIALLIALIVIGSLRRPTTRTWFVEP